MPRKYSLAYLTIPGTAPVEQIRLAAAAGYDCVSLRTIPMHLPNEPFLQLEKDEALFADVKKALADYGVALFDIELARVREDLDTADYEPAFEMGAALGAKNVLSSIWSENEVFQVEQFGIICDLAAKYGLDVNLEFVPISSVKDLHDARRVLAAAGRPNAKVMVDMLHACRSRVPLSELAAIKETEINFVHLCDAPEGFTEFGYDGMLKVIREDRLYPGEGAAGIAGMLSVLPYTPISIELPNLAEIRERGAQGHAARCLETAKAYLAEHGLS